MAEITLTELSEQIDELSEKVNELLGVKSHLAELLPPLREMEINQVARGGQAALEQWNARKKALQKKN